MMLSRFVLIACTLVTGVAQADDYSASDSGNTPRYTFSWPVGEGALKPRGGTTQGAPVTLDTNESPAWIGLRQKDISSFERDRRAILAMSGEYRVTFDFLEVASFVPPQERTAPYQSWGTEKIYVDRDTGSYISLVHILEMHMIDKKGVVSEPMVTKHWRQDWAYQPKSIVEYQGRDRWERRPLRAKQVRGAWSQTVYQVDESPRYASIGRWEHTGSFSTWLSADTWRPLPRREWSVRDDYHALIGTNRHTIHATGWTQEENNLKAVLTADRMLDPSRPFVAREYGMARYQRLEQGEFAAADRYYERTKMFWDAVRERWNSIFTTRGYAQLRGPVDQLGLFAPLFAHADAIAEQEPRTTTDSAVIDTALHKMGAL